MVRIETERLDADRMARMAREYGARGPDPEDLERALAARYPEEDAITCDRCGFRAPDTLEIPQCPGCGVAYGAHLPGEGRRETTMDSNVTIKTEAEVVPIGTQGSRPKRGPSTAMKKLARQKEEEEQDRASERNKEAVARMKLERLERSIEKSRAKGALLVYDIAEDLREIYDSDVWQTRVADMGYRSFIHYAKERWKIQKDMCWAYLQIAQVFKREQAKGLSPERLRLLARVPDDESREKLLKQVRDGKLATTDELADEVRKAREAAGASTTRPGDPNTVALAGRVKHGAMIAEGEFKAKGKRLAFRFELGGTEFDVFANEEDMGVEVRHVKPKK